jgi:hypothetical protein
MNLSPHWKTWYADNILPVTNLVPTGRQCARCSYLEHRWYSFERYMHVFNWAQ